jgi:hypothetical protein
MFLNVLLIADWWQAIARTCEHHVKESFWRLFLLEYDYAPRQQVLKKVPNPTK